MTLQWTAVALFLYAEIALNLILCIPFVSAKRYANSCFKGLKVPYGAHFQVFIFPALTPAEQDDLSQKLIPKLY